MRDHFNRSNYEGCLRACLEHLGIQFARLYIFQSMFCVDFLVCFFGEPSRDVNDRDRYGVRRHPE